MATMNPGRSPARQHRGVAPIVRSVKTLRALAVAAALSCAACSSAPDTNNTSKYTQTWAKSYADTTCTEWNTAMKSQQRFAAAADMLAGARNKGDGGSGLPPDSLIERFQADVAQGCSVAATMDQISVAEAGATVYSFGRDTYRP